MSADVPFRCPVCRASQTLHASCRRCQADLRLVLRAHLRLEYVKRLHAEAISRGDREGEQTLASELRWLAPERLYEGHSTGAAGSPGSGL